MREQNKYTHLIERVPGLGKELASGAVKELTGMTPSACYWRLREGKGLLSLYDQESLAMWSRLLADIRRYTGSPMSLSHGHARVIRLERMSLLRQMEAYRTWLEHGAMPTYHSQLYACANDAWRYAIMSYAVAHHLSSMGYDLSTPPGQSIWTMPADERAELRQQRRAMVREVIDTMAIDWQAVYDIAADMAVMVQHEQEFLNEKLRQLEERTMSPAISKSDLKELYRMMELVHQTSPLRILAERDYARLYDDEVWQIRTDFDCRSSAGAAIGSRLLWIRDVPSISEGHRGIYDNNNAVLQEFMTWKAKKKEELAEMKKNKKVHYNSEEIAAEITYYLKQIEIPPYPRMEKASLTD